MKIFFGMQNKFIAATSLFILVFTAIAGYILVSHESKLYTQEAENQARTIARISGIIFTNSLVYRELGLVEEINLTDYLDYYVSDLMNKDRRILYMVVLDPSGRVLAHSDIKEYGKVYKDDLTREALQDETSQVRGSVGGKGEKIIDVTGPLRISTKSWGVCRIGFDLGGVQDKINLLKKGIFSIMGIVLICSLVLISFAGKTLATPLVRLTQIMDRITDQKDIHIQEPAFEPRRDEVGMLQNSFSWMLKKLREADEEKKRTMDRMMQAEKMAAVGNIAAGVAHEINNPLGGVSLCFKNIVNGDLTPEERRVHIEVIHQGLDKIRDTVAQLLNYSRRSPMRMEMADINPIIDRSLNLVETMISRKRIEILKQLAPHLPRIQMDSGRMEQVFVNILINAGDAIEDQGQIRVTSAAEGRACRICIANTGPAIAQEDLQNIFEPFFTTKEPGKGTGLGLAISKAIVEQHGGTIQVVSGESQGVEFHISLPITEG